MSKTSFIVVDAGLTEVGVMRWHQGELSADKDRIAEETPIALIYNGISHVVMLATPQDLEDFALGFSLSEGILQDKGELYGIEIIRQEQGIELRLDVATECFVKLKERRRNLAGRTGCGLCGAESLEQALHFPQRHALQASIHAVSGASFQAAFHAIKPLQALQLATGATHACAWATADGEVQLVREDVGRHNAMDKLIGALAKWPPQSNGFVLTSSRASYEMVQKVAAAGYPILAAISAPTGLAVRMAEAYGVTLVGFLRDNQFVIYTNPHRIKP